MCEVLAYHRACFPKLITLRVQVPNNHRVTQTLYYNYYYPKPKYPIIWYMDPLGKLAGFSLGSAFQVPAVSSIGFAASL